MKISVIIPSRGRPFALARMFEGIRALESGKHEVSYTVGVDADDLETLAMCTILRLRDHKLGYRCFVRLGSLGVLCNRLAEENPGDVYAFLTDDVSVMTRDWDEAIARAWEARPDGVFWWRTTKQRPATYAIVSEKWRAAAGHIWTDYFPFWWDDMWLLDVWLNASGLPMLPIEAWLDDLPQMTLRMRRLRFWADFFMHQKGKRQAQAVKMAKALGWPRAPLDDNRCDVSAKFREQIDAIEAQQGDKGPPTPEYLKAEARAMSMMGVQHADHV